MTDGDNKLINLTTSNAKENLSSSELEKVSFMTHLWGDFDSKEGKALLEATTTGNVIVYGADIAACPYASALKQLVKSCAVLTRNGGCVIVA